MKGHHRILFLFPVLFLAAVLVTGYAYAADKAWLGVILQPLTVDLKEAMHLDRDLEGVLISDVVDDSPADEYGLEEGDVIVEIDGEAVETVSGATRIVKSHSPGDEVKIVVVRDGGKRRVVEVALGEPEEVDRSVIGLNVLPEIGKAFKQAWIHEDQGYLGVNVQNISDDLGDYFGVHGGEGVLVLDVMHDSPADEAGIKNGDVILKVDGKAMSDTEEFVKAIRQSEPGDVVKLDIKRKHRTQTVEAELGEAPASQLSKHFMKQYNIPMERNRKRIIVDTDKLKQEAKQLRIRRDDIEHELQQLKQEMKELRKEMDELKKS